MLFSDALEVAIGLVFIFLLVSLVTTAIVECIESVRRTRGSRLLEGIKEMMNDSLKPASGLDAAKAVYSHPLVQGLYIGHFDTAVATKQLPSYLPSRNFALALIDQILAGKVNAAVTNASLPEFTTLDNQLRLAAERIENEQLRLALLLAVKIGGNDIHRITQHLQEWFEGAMERVSGRYKRRTQQMTFALGLAGAILLNVNTLTIADALSKDATLRRAIVAQAEVAKDTPSAKDARQQIENLGLPLGWSDHAIDSLLKPTDRTTWLGVLGWLQIVLGYLLTSLAISLGAPFWFDILKRLMVIRATIKPGEKDSAPSTSPEIDKTGGPRALPDPAHQLAVSAAAKSTNDSGCIDSDIYAVIPLVGEKLYEEWS